MIKKMDPLTLHSTHLSIERLNERYQGNIILAVVCFACLKKNAHVQFKCVVFGGAEIFFKGSFEGLNESNKEYSPLFDFWELL